MDKELAQFTFEQFYLKFFQEYKDDVILCRQREKEGAQERKLVI